jgi:capsid protein
VKRAAKSPAKERQALSYRGIESTPNRRTPQTKTSAEVVMLPGTKRQAASATVRDDRRSFTVLAWMIRRHLDNVSRFTPHIRTGNDELNAIVRKLMAWHGVRRNFDALGRHGRDEMMRMFEACKVIGGDAGLLKVAGGKVQGIEGDRLATPGGSSGAYKHKGYDFTEEAIAFDAQGHRKAWCLCKRGGERGNTLEFERVIPAEDLFFDGYWPERFDSNRGVSPIITALNEGADVRETWEWLVLKAKASALFGLAFTRKSSDPLVPTQGEESETAPASEAVSYTQQLAASVKARGIINLDMDPGDDVKEIESNTPNPQAVEFTRELLRVILLALDIPFTFYDSLTASFSARIADRNEYEEACEWKRKKNTDILDEIYGGWLLPMWEQVDKFGLGAAMKAAKMSAEEVAASIRWVPAGKPWLDRSGEMSGHILALAAGVTSTPRICATYGDDAYEIAKEQKEYLEKAGIPLLYAQGGQVSVQSIMEGKVNGKQSDQTK